MRETLLPALLAGLPVAGYLILYLLALAATRPVRPEAAPATQDLPGDEPPAVVSLLAGRWELGEDAAESTLVDLAARRYLEFRQPGNDPMQTTVHVCDPNPAGLTPYERMVFDRVAGLTVGGVVPLPALTFRDSAAAKGFEKRLKARVIADARTRGLSQRRFGPGLLALLTAMAAAAATGVALAVLATLRNPGTLIASWMVTMTVLSGIAHRPLGERDTGSGRLVAARWLGVRAWLRNTEAFAELPPAAVAVWDRYLSYGCALGTTRVTSAVIDLGMGNRKRVWSSFGGTSDRSGSATSGAARDPDPSWHRVRVRYPAFWPRYGNTATRLIVRGVLSAGVGYLLLRFWTPGVAAAAREPGIGHRIVDVSAGVRHAGLLVGGLLLGYGLYLLVRTTIDVAVPKTVTGQVLWREVWRSTSGGENAPPRPWLHYLAIDDGVDDRTTAWAAPNDVISRCDDGDTVTVTVRRWSRRVIRMQLVERGTVHRVHAIDVDEQNTEALVAVAMGAAPAARAVPPQALLTADEVGRALGVPVSVRGAAAGPIPVTTAQFLLPDGQVVLMVLVLTGLAAQLGMRARHRGQPLPGIGDEAYAGPGFAIARRGEVIVALNVRTRFPVDPRAVQWLLATAAGRLSATVSPELA